MRNGTEGPRNLAANAIRALAIDATNAANSGHPGAPMGLADIGVVLFADVLRFDPDDPGWPNRDRLVLSNGHASMWLYSLLHLAGYDLPVEELKRFRQLGSKTPGHPEYGLTPGVETTTGPLGQGFGNAVGLALGARMAKARFNNDASNHLLFSHRVYCVLGDGCMMEGISGEAASLAGHLGLSELVAIYDDNGITIDGSTDIAFTEDVEARFVAYGWNVLRVDGHDQEAIRATFKQAQAEQAKPTLIIARTHIGFGSPGRQDSPKAHGEPLGAEEGARTKQALGWSGAPFEVPEVARDVFRPARERGAAERASWYAQLESRRATDQDFSHLWQSYWSSSDDKENQSLVEAALSATRDASGATRSLGNLALNALAKVIPSLVGGSADLAASNKTVIKDSAFVDAQSGIGRNIHFGVREHAMGAVVNGLALYGAFLPFGATFLTFSDYMRPAIRLSALMRLRSLWVFTHDSIGLGEDGPTHQPIEHLWALRLIPGLTVWRPADGIETAMSWTYAAREGLSSPHALILSRQDVVKLSRPEDFDPATIWRGGYVLVEAELPKVVIMATGTEVGLALEVSSVLNDRNIGVRVVSMPSVERFLAQEASYRAQILPKDVLTVSIEAGRTGPWKMFTGTEGLQFGVDTFGESAPIADLYAHFGLTADAIADRILSALK
jgi:transketolase